MQFQKNNLDNYKKSKRTNRKFVPENLPDSENEGEMIYTEPNANQDSIPMMESQEQIFDPNEQTYQSQREKPRYQIFRRLNEPRRQDPSNKEEEKIRERSPKYVIDVGSSGDDYEVRMPNLPRRSQNYPNINNENYDGNQYEDDDNQEYQNESENPKTTIYSRNRSPQDGQQYRNNSPPGYREVIPENQMSPPQTFEEFNTSTDKTNEQNINNYNKQRNYICNNRQNYRPNQTYQSRQGYPNNPNRTVKNPGVINVLRDEVSNKYNNQTYNNMSYKDIQKISNRFSKVYDPHKNSNGILLEESQITLPGAQDEVFNNRYKVLSKMNRLSNILLAKKRGDPPKPTVSTKTYNRNNSYDNPKKQFDRHTLERSPHDGKNRRAFSRSPNHKFLYVSLAMLSSKGPQTEDRPILRWMRLEKGGVVDLAQEERKKNKFQIKKALPKKGLLKGFYANPRYRDKAARVIQSWWRELKNIYNDRLAKIIKIQSVFRGKFVRKYMYDLFYLNFLYISFCKKIEHVLAKHIKPYVLKKLLEELNEPENSESPRRREKLERLVSRDYRNDLNSIYPAWKKWLSNTRKLNMQNYKSRNLLQIRADKENRLNELRNAFNKWRYVNKVLDAEDKLSENDKKNQDDILKNKKNLQKIQGLFNLVDGIDKYVKKEAMNETLPKLEDYLKNQKGKGKLKKIVNRKPKYDQNLLRKYFYRWLANAFKEKEDDDKKDLDDKQKKNWKI